MGTKIPINSDLCVHDVEKVSMACRACDHYLWKSLNLLKRVLVADGKNLKGGGFDSPWVRYVKKRPVSDLVLTATTIKTVKMLCHTVHNVYKNCLQDGVGTSPGATINSGEKKKFFLRILQSLIGFLSIIYFKHLKK